MTALGTKIYTWAFGELVGEDEFGNKYYKSKKSEGKGVGRRGTERRWVVYNGTAEPSKIPSYWHGWMHHITDVEPAEENRKKQYDWEKPHNPNLTGTKFAYFPPGDVRAGGKRAKASSDYKPWKPE